MFLLIIGIILFVIGNATRNSEGAIARFSNGIRISGIVVAVIAVAEIVVVEVAGAEALAKLRFDVGCLAAHLGCLASEKGRLLETYENSRADE